jgi:hypothetical protein
MRSRGYLRSLIGKLFAGSGCTLLQHPMPELREVGHELAAPKA